MGSGSSRARRFRLRSVLSVRSARGFGYAVAAATGLASIALMATAGWLLASAWEQPPILHLQIAIVGVRAFAIGRAALRYLERLASHRVAIYGLSALREQVYRRLAGSPVEVS